MSKSKANGIRPDELVSEFGSDAYRYYFARALTFGSDGSISYEDMHARYHADLANGLGNLASRVAAMIGKYFGGQLPAGRARSPPPSRRSSIWRPPPSPMRMPRSTRWRRTRRWPRCGGSSTPSTATSPSRRRGRSPRRTWSERARSSPRLPRVCACWPSCWRRSCRRRPRSCGSRSGPTSRWARWPTSASPMPRRGTSCPTGSHRHQVGVAVPAHRSVTLTPGWPEAPVPLPSPVVDNHCHLDHPPLLGCRRGAGPGCRGRRHADRAGRLRSGELAMGRRHGTRVHFGRRGRRSAPQRGTRTRRCRDARRRAGRDRPARRRPARAGRGGDRAGLLPHR